MALLIVRRGSRLAVVSGLALALSVLRDVALSHPLAAQVAEPRAQADARAEATDSLLEYRVKAAYLLNFTRYIEWPSEAYRSPSAPTVLCVYGANPFGAMLDHTIRGRTSQGRLLEAREIETAVDAKGCHVVFVSYAEWRRRPEILSQLAKRGILTVGEGAAFAEAGGIISFVIEEQSVRFAVNLTAGEKSGLQLSSRMLAIASRVYGEPKPAGEKPAGEP